MCIRDSRIAVIGREHQQRITSLIPQVNRHSSVEVGGQRRGIPGARHVEESTSQFFEVSARLCVVLTHLVESRQRYRLTGTGEKCMMDADERRS